MLKLSQIIVLTVTISSGFANYHGPFLLWGRDELKNLRSGTLRELDDKVLRNIYSDSPAIILFMRNASSDLNEANFPSLQNLLQNNKYLYVPQRWLPSDPMDYNVNAEVSVLHLNRWFSV